MSVDNEPQVGAGKFKATCNGGCHSTRTFLVVECSGSESNRWCRVLGKCIDCGWETTAQMSKSALSCFDQAKGRCHKGSKPTKKAENTKKEEKSGFFARLFGR